MRLQEFKTLMGIVTPLQFYPSTKGSGRFVASINGTSKLLVTKPGYDTKNPAKFVYNNPEAAEGNSWILSNTEPKEATFTE